MKDKNQKMAKNLTFLFRRLSAKGLEPVEITRFIKDVLCIIGGGGDFTVAGVNQELDRLGWGNEIIDGVAFELIIYFFECGDLYSVRSHPIH